MYPATSYTDTEFSRLLAGADGHKPLSLARSLRAINGAGVWIAAPTLPINNYLKLLHQEMLVKKRHLSPHQPVQYLRLRGLPFNQFRRDEITELLFWLCSHFNVLDGCEAERSIRLTSEQCSSNNLALLKGLGFNNLRIFIEVSMAGPDRSLNSLEKALSGIANYPDTSLSGEIFFSADTSPLFLEAVMDLLIEKDITELEYQWLDQRSAPPRDAAAHQAIFTDISGRMEKAAYHLLGNKVFKRRDDRELALLSDNRLGYGPWGFHNKGACEWIGLGLGAPGMINGYLCHNTSDLGRYSEHLSAGTSPVSRWGDRPVIHDGRFRFIEDLYCAHRVEKQYFAGRGELLDLLIEREWMMIDREFIQLTLLGKLNISAISRLYARFDIRSQAD